MKKIIITTGLLITILFNNFAQEDAGFSFVPVVNGKVVFEQFIITDPGQNAEQKYARLEQWIKQKYSGNPILTGIRFDVKGRYVAVSAKENMLLPANSACVREEVTMNYRFDTSITGAGCMLVVRDITYQQNGKEKGARFGKVYTAEQVITDQAVNSANEEGELRGSARKATLAFMNTLYSELSALF